MPNEYGSVVIRPAERAGIGTVAGMTETPGFEVVFNYRLHSVTVIFATSGAQAHGAAEQCQCGSCYAVIPISSSHLQRANDTFNLLFTRFGEF